MNLDDPWQQLAMSKNNECDECLNDRGPTVCPSPSTQPFVNVIHRQCQNLREVIRLHFSLVTIYNFLMNYVCVCVFSFYDLLLV